MWLIWQKNSNYIVQVNQGVPEDIFVLFNLRRFFWKYLLIFRLDCSGLVRGWGKSSILLFSEPEFFSVPTFIRGMKFREDGFGEKFALVKVRIWTFYFALFYDDVGSIFFGGPKPVGK